MDYKLNNAISVDSVCDFLGVDKPSEKGLIKSVSQLSCLSKESLSFANSIQDRIDTGYVLAFPEQPGENIIGVDNPRLAFCNVLNFLIDNGYLDVSKIHGTGVIDSSASVSARAVIEEGAVIGANTIVEPNVVIHSGAVIGKNCIIRSGSIIGAQGFGFEKDDSGRNIRFPHLGRVTIGDDVEIGALNSVSVGTLSDTIISNGVKTDNLVHIAHNCFVGENSIITASAELSGGVKLGKNVWVGPNASILQKLIVGDNALVGIGAVVTKNVEPNTKVAGNPARKLKS